MQRRLTPLSAEENSEVQIDMNSVCHLLDSTCISFSDLSVDDILNELKVEAPATHGNRLMAYYGNISYRYGHVRHEASEYPQGKTFDTIFSRMQAAVPDFTKSNYSCLVTLYRNGNSYINFHSDSAQLQPNSTIYTVSVGGDRTIVFQNQLGVINERRVHIPHGSVYAMSSDSQSTWRHSIPADSSTNRPRISFTFRKLVPESDAPKRPQAPPICHPDKYAFPNSPPHGTHNGILLLTDSILSQTPDHIFDRIPGHRLIKKENKRLVDVTSFEPEFKYRRAVVFSCGVNDLSCYGYRGDVLVDLMGPRIADSCRNYPNTSFIFNSILYTRHEWLNNEIDTTNKLMFELSLTLPNFYFFDSSAILSTHPLGNKWDDVIDPRDPRRLHITHAARTLISDHLVNGLELICRRSAGRSLPPALHNWVWPLRTYFLRAIPQLKARLGPRAVSHDLLSGT